MSEPGGDPSSGISSGDALILPERHPACRRREARPGFRTERENLCFVTSDDVKGEAASGSNREGESTGAGHRGGAARSVCLTADVSGGLKSHSARGPGLISKGGGNVSLVKHQPKISRLFSYTTPFR